MTIYMVVEIDEKAMGLQIKFESRHRRVTTSELKIESVLIDRIKKAIDVSDILGPATSREEHND